MKRSLFQLPSLGSVCLPCRQRMAQAQALSPFQTRQKRLFTTTNRGLADADKSFLDSLNNLARSSTPRPTDSNKPSRLFTPRPAISPYESIIPDGSIQNVANTGPPPSLTRTPVVRPHHLHIYATRHNCHITLTSGNRDPIISVSSGNIGFKKSQRGTYDAAYQLGVYVMGLINNQAMLDERYQGKGGQIRQLEVVLRDFGPGREALTKIILGGEGKLLRGRIVRVMDATRLKFGGSRSKKPRRLG